MNRLVRRLVLATLAGVVLYAGFVVWRDHREVGRAVGAFAWPAFFAACALALLNYLLRFVRWQYYLRLLEVRGIPAWESLLVFLSGFVLTITPGKLGEMFKSMVLHDTRGVDPARTAPIVIAERLTDVLGVVVLIALGSLGFSGGLWWGAGGAAAALLGLVLIGHPSLAERLLGLLPRLPGPFGRVGTRAAPALLRSTTALRTLTSPRALALPTLLAIAAWFFEGVSLWVILVGMGTALGVPLSCFFYATSTLAGALIPVPGGLGVTEKLLEEQLARLGGVPIATATASMILVRFATLWFGVLVGFLALTGLRMRFPGLLSRDAAAVRPEGGPPPGDPTTTKDATSLG